MPNEKASKDDVTIASLESGNAGVTSETIKLYRKRAGLTQAQVAKAVGLSENTICRYEKGLRSVPHDIFVKILLYCNSGIPTTGQNLLARNNQRQSNRYQIDEYLDKLSDENVAIVATIARALVLTQGDEYATKEEGQG